jgi:hypothetical protein
MIVKNEEDFLDSSIKSAKELVDFEEIVVADTGSTDKTVEIARDNNARVVSFVWCDDFSAARNFAADNVKTDWVFMLDADERVVEADINKLERFIKEKRAVGSFRRIELTDNAVVNESRLYNRKYHRYEGNIHEQITPLDSHPKIVKPAPIVLAHYGYLPDVKTAKSKYERNVRLLEEALSKKPNDPYLLFQLGKCHSVNNGDLKKACEYFERTLEAKEDYRLEYVYYTVELYGYALINTEQYEKALELLKKFKSKYKQKPEFRFLSAHIYQNNGLFQEAVECYESCIGADTYDARGITSFLSYYNIGVILECVGMIEAAVLMYSYCGDYEPAKKRLAEIRK